MHEVRWSATLIPAQDPSTTILNTAYLLTFDCTVNTKPHKWWEKKEGKKNSLGEKVGICDRTNATTVYLFICLSSGYRQRLTHNCKTQFLSTGSPTVSSTLGFLWGAALTTTKKVANAKMIWGSLNLYWGPGELNWNHVQDSRTPSYIRQGRAQ